MTPITHHGRVRISQQELDEEIDRLPFSDHERAALWLIAHHQRETVTRITDPR